MLSSESFTNEQDVFQGTQLLAIDVAAAMELLRRVLIGDELAEKEKKALQRTLTDLASVVPIGVLMLLPVSSSTSFCQNRVCQCIVDQSLSSF